MVNAVSSINLANKASEAAKIAEIKKLVSYVNNETLKQVPDTFVSTTKSGAKSTGVFNGVPFVNFLKNKFIAKKMFSTDVTAMSQKLVEGDKATVEAFKNIFKKGGKLTEKLANYANTVDANAEVFSSVTKATKFAKKSTQAYAKAGKVADKLTKKSGNKLLTFFRNRKLVRLTAKAGKFEAAAEGTAKAALNKTGAKVAAEGAKNLSKLGKLGKAFKASGAPFMLAFSGITEAATEVIPTFKELGKEKGMKQVGKSTIKVVGDTAGFIAGQAVGKYAGAIVGAKVGAALGSVVPGIGNVIGAAVGLVGGLLGSFIAGKITKAITGPSEREIAKEQQTKEAVEEIANNEEALDALKQATVDKMQQEIDETGEMSEDSYAALESLSKLEKQSNPFVAQA